MPLATRTEFNVNLVKRGSLQNKPAEVPKEQKKGLKMASKFDKKKIEKPEAKAVEEVKPSMDWTQKEIAEYGVSKGLEFPEGATKREMLEIIEGGKNE